jgi:hypothetical protein
MPQHQIPGFDRMANNFNSSCHLSWEFGAVAIGSQIEDLTQTHSCVFPQLPGLRIVSHLLNGHSIGEENNKIVN